MNKKHWIRFKYEGKYFKKPKDGLFFYLDEDFIRYYDDCHLDSTTAEELDDLMLGTTFYDDTDIIMINAKSIVRSYPRKYLDVMASIISHEKIHQIIEKLEGYDVTVKFDNIDGEYNNKSLTYINTRRKEVKKEC